MVAFPSMSSGTWAQPLPDDGRSDNDPAGWAERLCRRSAVQALDFSADSHPSEIGPVPREPARRGPCIPCRDSTSPSFSSVISCALCGEGIDVPAHSANPRKMLNSWIHVSPKFQLRTRLQISTCRSHTRLVHAPGGSLHGRIPRGSQAILVA